MQCRREHETREHRRLLDKQQRLEAILASLEQSGADATQKEEIEEMINPTEKAQLAKVKHMTTKYGLGPCIHAWKGSLWAAELMTYKVVVDERRFAFITR